MSKKIKTTNDLALVLNENMGELTDATMAVRWFFSSKLSEKQPTHLLLIDLTPHEEECEGSGRRYVVKVETGVKFIQLHRSGKHKLVALAFENEKLAYSYLQKDQYNAYKHHVPLKLIGNPAETFGESLADKIIEFTVPKELFAQKPKSKVGQLWWKYIFWPKLPNEKDECQVKKLSWFYSLPKFPLFLIVNLLYSLYTVLASLIFLFIGFWPLTGKRLMRRICHPVQENWSLNVASHGNNTKFLHIYDRYGQPNGKKLWFSPLLLISLAGILMADYNLIKSINFNPLHLLLFFIAGGIATPLLLSINLKNFIKEKHEDTFYRAAAGLALLVMIGAIIYSFIAGEPSPDAKVYYYLIPSVIGISLLLAIYSAFIKETVEDYIDDVKYSIRKRRRESYKNYLKRNFGILGASNLDYLPDTFKESQLKRNAVVRFWTIKRKVCRPYES